MLPSLLALALLWGLSAAPVEDPLPALARGLLKKRMEGHGRQQTRLVMAVTLLQRDVVKVLANDIAAEPRLVRPRAGALDELNSALPERFFVFQDSLRDRAKALAAAAEQRDDVGLAKSFGELVEACVSCHSSFRKQQ